MNLPSLSSIPVTLLNWLKLAGVAVLLVAAFFVWKSCQGKPKPSPVFPANVKVPTEGKDIPRKVSEATAPVGYHGGVAHVTVKDTIRQEDVGKIKERDVTVYLPNDPQEDPPIYVIGPGSPGITVDMMYQYVSDPVATIKPNLFVGGSGDGVPTVSPFLGVSGLEVFKVVHFGAGVDRMALGPFISGEYRYVNLGIKWQALRFRKDASAWCVFLAWNVL